jgi:hypothetical protein
VTAIHQPRPKIKIKPGVSVGDNTFQQHRIMGPSSEILLEKGNRPLPGKLGLCFIVTWR